MSLAAMRQPKSMTWMVCDVGGRVNVNRSRLAQLLLYLYYSASPLRIYTLRACVAE